MSWQSPACHSAETGPAEECRAGYHPGGREGREGGREGKRKGGKDGWKNDGREKENVHFRESEAHISLYIN